MVVVQLLVVSDFEMKAAWQMIVLVIAIVAFCSGCSSLSPSGANESYLESQGLYHYPQAYPSDQLNVPIWGEWQQSR
jgi:hypothetical protein